MTTASFPPRPNSGSSLRPIEERDLAGYGSAFDIDCDDDDLYYEGYQVGWGDRLRAMVGHFLVRLGWLALAGGLALGSAGIVAAGQHSPSSGARPELTWAADQQLSTRLDADVRDLARLNDDVDSLGTQARKTLSNLTQLNEPGLKAAWDAGWNNVNSIDAEAADLSTRMQCGEWDATLQESLTKTNSPAMVDRYHKVCLAVTSVAPLHDDWQGIVDGSQTAISVKDDIDTHDSLGADALKLATSGRYPQALAELSKASAAIADAATIASVLSTTADVSQLSKWLTLTTQMDGALRLLWQAMIDSKGVMTKQVAAALRNEDAAAKNLRGTNNALEAVVLEVAGNLTADGISIETAKGQLTNALADLTGGTVFGE
jgi:hypothetical protein